MTKKIKSKAGERTHGQVAEKTPSRTPGNWRTSITLSQPAFNGDWATDIMTDDKAAGLCVGVLCTSATRPHGEAVANANMMALAPELFEFVLDYFTEADCGNGGEHDEDKTHGECWHCTSRRLVESIKGKATPEGMVK